MPCVPELPADVLRNDFGHLSIHSLAHRVRWILHNPIYAGYTTLNGDLLPGRHEAIVDPDTWLRVQEIFALRRSWRLRFADMGLQTGSLSAGPSTAADHNSDPRHAIRLLRVQANWHPRRATNELL